MNFSSIFWRRSIIGTRISKTWIHPFLALFLAIGIGSNVSFANMLSIEERILRDKDARWEITADKMTYNEETGLISAEGDVVITRGEQKLSAERAEYNEKTGIVEVSGDIRLESYGDFLTGQSGVFDLNKGTGQLTKAKVFLVENNFTISGESLERVGINTYRIKDFSMTTCDVEKPAWRVTGSEIEVTIEGYGKVKNAAFRIQDFPVLYIPYGIFPAKTKRQTGLLPPAGGYSSLNGAVMEVPIFWAISEQTDATFYERFMSERGLMQGLEFRYVAEKDSKGMFLFDILADDREEKDLNDSDQVDISPYPRTNETRYWLRSKTDQQMPWGVEARFDTDYVSDQDYLREFGQGLTGFEARPDLSEAFGRPLDDIWSPTRRSALRLSRDGQAYSLQALSSYYEIPENPPDDRTPQPLAALDFSLLPRAIPKMPLFFTFNTNFDYVWRETGIGGQSLSVTPVLSYPLWFGRYLEFETSLAYSADIQWLDENPENVNRQSRDVYQVQAGFSTVLERVFAFRRRDVTKLKHKILPRLTYDYRVPQDRGDIDAWFDPIDAEGKINRVTLSLENFLDARKESDKGEVTYSQLGYLRLSQGYNLDEARQETDSTEEGNLFEPLEGRLNLRPFPGLSLDAGASWDWDADAISLADVSFLYLLNRSGGRQDRFEIDYNYTRGEANFLSANIDLNLGYGFSVGGGLKRNLELGENVASRLWIDYQSKCWGMRVTGEEDEANQGIMVTFRLLGLGGI